MRIERVEPCEHATGWNTTEHGEHRTVLDGFPPEAYEAAKQAIRTVLDGERNYTHKMPDDLMDLFAEAASQFALEDAWRVLTGDTE